MIKKYQGRKNEKSTLKTKKEEEKKMTVLQKTGLAYYDAHYPHHNRPLWMNFLKLVRKMKPDVFVFGGDNMNMDAVDHWMEDHKKVRQMEGKRVLAEYEGFKKEMLNPLEKALPKGCRKIWLDGNHEAWMELAIDKNPNGEGYWEVENNLHLKERGWETYKYGEYAKVGKILFIHGQYTNQGHAKKTVNVYEKNVVYGHDHAPQLFTKITPVENEPHTGMALPCGCEMNPHFMRNRPHAWVNGFLVFYFTKKIFSLFPVTSIFDGKFIAPSGKRY